MRIRHRREAGAQAQADALVAALEAGVPVYSTDGRTVDDIVADELRGRGLTRRGRRVLHGRAARLPHHRARRAAPTTSLGGVISYSNQAKMDLLQVPPGMLAQYGAVSEEVAGAMAEGAREALRADYALSRHRRRRPGRRHAGEAGRPRLPRLRRSRRHAGAPGLVPRRPRQRAHVQRHLGAPPAAPRAAVVSAGAQAKPERLRLFVACDLPRGRRARRRGVAARRNSPRTRTCASCPRCTSRWPFSAVVDAARVPDLRARPRRHRLEARRVPPQGAALPAGARQATGRGARAGRPVGDPAPAAGRGVVRARGRRPLRAREAALAAARHGGQIPPSRSPVFPAKREHRRVWCRPDGLV